MTEAELSAQIRALCTELHLHGFSITTYQIPGASRRPGSSKGFPDWVIAGRSKILFAELKSATGRRSRAQIRWAQAIIAAGGDYVLWRPADLTGGTIRQQLQAIR